MRLIYKFTARVNTVTLRFYFIFLNEIQIVLISG